MFIASVQILTISASEYVFFLVVVSFFLVVVSFFCTMSVDASRNAIISFFKDEFKVHTEITFQADKNDTDYIPKCIEKVYTIKQVPDNFEKTLYYKDEERVVTQWTNSDEKIISLDQNIMKNTHEYDTEETFIKETKINGFKVYTYSKRGYTIYTWEEKGYVFTLRVPNEIKQKLARSSIGNMIRVN